MGDSHAKRQTAGPVQLQGCTKWWWRERVAINRHAVVKKQGNEAIPEEDIHTVLKYEQELARFGGSEMHTYSRQNIQMDKNTYT